MNKIFINKAIRGYLFLFATLSVIHVQAQQQVVEVSDSLKITKQIEQGYLLKIDKINSTSSISSVSGETLYKTPQPNLTNTLFGRLSGLTVMQNTGEPGFDAASLYIRGRGTYDNASMTIYIDGFESTMKYLQFLSPSEIESVSVLKDAAALAPFGMKGGNGVLWVTTKRGEIGKRTITVGVRTGFQQPIIMNKSLNSYDFANLYNQANSNDNNNRVWTPTYSGTELNAYKNGTGTNVDWYQQTLRTSTPLNTDANVSIKGGDQTAKYMVLLNYAKNEGLANVPTNERTSNEQLQQYNLRTNLDINLFKIVEAKIDLGGRIENRNGPNYNGGQLFADLARYPDNIYPIKDITGNWSGTTLYPNNPVGTINGLGWYRNHDRVLTANFSLKERLDFITKGLYISEAASFNTYTQTSSKVQSTYARYYNGAKTTNDINADIAATSEAPITQYNWKQFTGTAGYDRQFGKHEISTAINYLQSSYYTEGVHSLINYENVGGRFNYAFDNRYIAEFGFAYSGADNYAPGNQWGFYPAVSAAWVISNESFLKSSKFVDFLKLRVSAGKVGNNQTYSGNYRYQLYYNGTNNFITGDSKATTSGLVQSYASNPTIFAEQSLKYDIGIDTKLFKNLSISLDAFMDKRSGIITIDNSYSATLGVNLPYRNVGLVTNKGFEITATYQDKIGGLGYFITGMVSYASNVIDYNAEIPPAYAYNGMTGRAIGTPLGLINQGFYQLDDFNSDGTLKTDLAIPAFGSVQPGDLKYKDLTDDGKIDQNDRTKIGESDLPTSTYSLNLGLSYQNFDFQVLAQGAGNRMVNLLDNWNQTVAFVGNGNAYEIAKGAWAYYPDQNIDTRATATYPRLTTQSNSNNYQNSTFWEKNADFIRIRNIELGYSLPKALLNKSYIQNVRCYLNALNPFTLSAFMNDNHLDPEVLSGYPTLKSYAVGVIVSF